MFNIAEELFAPGRKHTDEERQRMSLVVDDVGDGDPGKGPIDLASGTVVVRTAPPRRDRDAEPSRGPSQPGVGSPNVP
ncbi:DUF6191 domain-containing protein [Streptomyces lydicamycinicus]|uniref:Regulatory protein n=1 Tax=Streptomyces lydicamycinicus TaxID=1546107 RepID=A0A0P4R1K5_9ACTN|nr:DUF6191 domain-containing protein [Streptomyces lydicamycinicus]USA01177.1 DUF6191 domain-containing protein [Streptomyces lydicamycinicus]GAO06565.1 hypothetical protein TPA0598_01_09360 [Streptomyces lydicamycinicus]